MVLQRGAMVLCSTCVGLGLALSGAPPAMAQAMARGDVIITKGSLGAKDKARQQRVMLDHGPAGWEIVLQSDNPMAADLDLYVYDGLETGSRGRALCSSEGIDALEICRVIPVPTGPVMVEVVPNGGDGQTTFLLSRRPLQGPRMGTSLAVAADASPLKRGEWATIGPRAKGEPKLVSGLGDTRLFELEVGPGDGKAWSIVVNSDDAVTAPTLHVFGEDGNELADSVPRGAYQERSLRNLSSPGQKVFALVAPGRNTRGVVPYAIGVFPEGAPIPIRADVDEWIATGDAEKSYLLRLHAGESAIVKLEGTGASLSVTDSEQRVTPVASLFGSAQQVAWIGDPVGASKQLLSGVGGDRQLNLGVKQGAALGYNRSRGWTLHVHTIRTQPNYVFRLAVEDADFWRDWWSSPVATRTDSTVRGGTKIIAIQQPFDLERPAPNRPAQLSTRQMAPPPAVFYARLQGSTGWHLAICTVDGQVLDIGGVSPIRWEWAAGLGQLYLVVFPNPQEPGQQGGPFRLELTRSLITGAKP
jgi:hypothetical protein